MFASMTTRFHLVAIPALLAITSLTAVTTSFAQEQAREDEMVASLAGGRVIVDVARDTIIFAAIDVPIERNSIPPRVMGLDSGHIGILLGASEWRTPADPKPIRVDRNFQRIGARDPRDERAPGEAEPDLETIGTAFLEKLRPLIGQLHHKLDFSPTDPVFQLVIIGNAPSDYGPEVWVAEYFMEQEMIASRAEYWQTRLLRPRFTQLYPPEKHAPHTLVESRFPATLKGPTLEEMIKSNDPRLASALQNARFEKVLENLRAGTAQKAVSADSADFMRSVLLLIAGDSPFILGTIGGQRGALEWIVPPSEPVEKVQEDKNPPPEAPPPPPQIKP